MAYTTGQPIIGEVDLYKSTTAPTGGNYCGQLLYGAQGKAFRYVKAGELLVVGNVLQSAVLSTQFDDMAVATNIALQTNTEITPLVITNGTVVLVSGELAGATLEVSVTPGLGDEYTIVANSAAGSGAALSLTLDRPIRTALTSAASKVTIRRNPWFGVIQSPATTLTGETAGVAIFAIASGEYGWVQTHGVGAVLSDGSSILAGSPVAVPSGTAGATILGAGGLKTIGQAMRAGASGKTIPVLLSID